MSLVVFYFAVSYIMHFCKAKWVFLTLERTWIHLCQYPKNANFWLILWSCIASILKGFRYQSQSGNRITGRHLFFTCQSVQKSVFTFWTERKGIFPGAPSMYKSKKPHTEEGPNNYDNALKQWWANPVMFKSKSKYSPIFKSKSTLLKKPKSNPNPM